MAFPIPALILCCKFVHVLVEKLQWRLLVSGHSRPGTGRASMKAGLLDEWGRSLRKSCQRLPICLETKILERLEGFLGAMLLCRFFKCLGRWQSSELSFPPSGSCQDRVGVSGPGPGRRTGGRNVQGPCVGMVAMFGLWPWGEAQACHCSTPSGLHAGKQEGLRKARE